MAQSTDTNHLIESAIYSEMLLDGGFLNTLQDKVRKLCERAWRGHVLVT